MTAMATATVMGTTTTDCATSKHPRSSGRGCFDVAIKTSSSRTWRRLAAAGLVAGVTAVALGSPAHAEPMDPIPGEGFFVVGRDVGLGLYRTDGTASTFGVWINDVPTQDSMCLWFTYSTPGPDKAHVVATNMSLGPMYANINPTVQSFESHNCRPWVRVP
ncbi:hypothetical protein EV589_2975 [Mycobacterium sp. BK558]|nr:hypothetical protein EV589_2975 [Mycobacterium sp. BK558]